MWFFRLGFLFVTVSFLELFLLLQTGKWMGIPATIILIFFTGFLGAYLARQQGLQTLQSISKSFNEGVMPANEMLDGVCILIAAAFLVTPGLLTDTVGFALLTPAFRRMIRSMLQRRMKKWLSEGKVFVHHQRVPPVHYDIEQ